MCCVKNQVALFTQALPVHSLSISGQHPLRTVSAQILSHQSALSRAPPPLRLHAPPAAAATAAAATAAAAEAAHFPRFSSRAASSAIAALIDPHVTA